MKVQIYRPHKALLLRQLAAMLNCGSLLDPIPRRCIGVSAAKPHDLERLKKSQERQAKKRAAREAIRRKNGHA